MIRDLLFFAGLSCLCVGLWWWAPWVSMSVGGGLLMGLAAWGHLIGGAK